MSLARSAHPAVRLLKIFFPGLLLIAGSSRFCSAALLSDPEVDAFNVRLGTQTFAPKYHFTTNTALVETAEAIRAMGSDVLKFYLGRGFSGQYRRPLPGSINSLADLASREPSCRRVLDMPFRHFLVWAYCFGAGAGAAWKNGMSPAQAERERAEIYELCSFLLTNYNNSGKSFYLGHWEGDWHLLPNYNAKVNPSTAAIQGMIQWLNVRQKAVDDAVREVPHTNVFVYHYTEVNRVRDAMLNGATNNQRLVNAVLPCVTNIDFVSWSSYDGMDLEEQELHKTLEYIEAYMPRAKASKIPGRRVFIGEYGWGGTLSSTAQEEPTRRYVRRLLPWSPRFILFWQMYDNEAKSYWLIDSNRTETPSYHFHREFINRARLRVAQFKEARGRLPSDSEFSDLLRAHLEKPLAAPPRLALSDLKWSHATNGTINMTATLAQGLYKDEGAAVWCFWGKRDGGTSRMAWKNARFCGINSRYNPAPFSATAAGLQVGETYFFTFFASNATCRAWAPAAKTFTAAGTRSTSSASPKGR